MHLLHHTHQPWSGLVRSKNQFTFLRYMKIIVFSESKHAGNRYNPTVLMSCLPHAVRHINLEMPAIFKKYLNIVRNNVPNKLTVCYYVMLASTY